MTKMSRFSSHLGAASFIAALAAIAPAAAQTAKASLKDADGKAVGTAELIQSPAGVLVKLAVKGLPAGEHAFHVHAVGKCEPPFNSAAATSIPATRSTA